MRKKATIIALCMIFIALAFVGCGGQGMDITVSNTDEQYAAAHTEESEAAQEDGGAVEDASVEVSRDMTNAKADEIYALMKSHDFETLRSTYPEEWISLGDEQRRQAAEDLLAIANGLGRPSDMSEQDLLYALDDGLMPEDEIIPSYPTAWSLGCEILGIDDHYYYLGLYYYRESVEEGYIHPAPDEIIAVADSLHPTFGSEENATLCLGHVLDYIAEPEAKLEEGFMNNFSVYPGPGTDAELAVYYAGYKGAFDNIAIGEMDMLPILMEMGVVGAGKTILHYPIHFCAIDAMNAPQLFILARNDTGATQIAMLSYSSASGQYEWDRQIYQTTELACFSSDGVFHFIDNTGAMQSLSA